VEIFSRLDRWKTRPFAGDRQRGIPVELVLADFFITHQFPKNYE
jgi:hypothetical protein